MSKPEDERDYTLVFKSGEDAVNLKVIKLRNNSSFLVVESNDFYVWVRPLAESLQALESLFPKKEVTKKN